MSSPPSSASGTVRVEPISRALLQGVPDPEAPPVEPPSEAADAEPTESPEPAAAPGRTAARARVRARAQRRDPPPPPPRRRLDLGVLPVFEDERPLSGLAGFLDWRAGGRLSSLVRTGWYAPREGSAMLLPARRTQPVARMVLFGLGRAAAFDEQAARRLAAQMVGVARRLRPRDVLLSMPGNGAERAAVEAVFAACVEALREDDPEVEPCPVWVVADPRHVARLRRLLEGPPRAAGD